MRSGAIFVAMIAGLVVIGLVSYYFVPWGKFDPVAATTLFVGVLASLLAIWAIFSQRAIVRRQVTLEHIATLDRDGDLIRGRAKFRELAKSDGGLQAWAAADKEQTPEFQVIVTRLNEFELVSIGIQRGIIDYELYSRWFKSGTVRAWRDAEPFIMALRRRLDNQMLFHEFGEMVKWFENQRPPKRGRFWGSLF